MNEFFTSILHQSILFIVLGAIFIAFDYKWGVKLVEYLRTWKSDPESDLDVKGIVFNRSIGWKAIVAFKIALLCDIIIALNGEKTVISEAFSAVFEVPIVMLGFVLGPWLGQLIALMIGGTEALEKFRQKINNGTLKIEIVEKFDDAKEEITEKFNEAKYAAEDVFDSAKKRFSGVDSNEDSENEDEPVDEVVEKPLTAEQIREQRKQRSEEALEKLKADSETK